MRKLILFVAVMMVGSFAWGQAPNIQWAKCYGGTLEDQPNSISQTIDGGYIMAGYSKSNDGDVTGHHPCNCNGDSPDFWVAKINAIGALEWQKSLGGKYSEYALSIEQTNDSGYIIAGYSTSNDGDVSGHHGAIINSGDYWIVKLNSLGVIQWQKSLGGSDGDYATTIHQTSDGGYVIAGRSNSNDGDVTVHHDTISSNSDYWIVKLNSIGTIQWQKSFGGTYDDWTFDIQQTKDSGYIVAGGASSNSGDITGHLGTTDNPDYWVVKLNSIGVLQWQKSYGGTEWDNAKSIQQTIDGGYIIVGESFSTDGDVTGNHGSNDLWVVKIDSTGVIQWQKSLGGSNTEYPNSIKQTSDSGYVVVGYTASNDGDVTNLHDTTNNYTDYWVVKLNSGGVLQWQKTLGGIGFDMATSVLQTTDSGYIVAGRTFSNNCDVSGNHGSYDYWVVKLSKDSLVGINELPTSSITISPNPTTGIITIKGITQPTVAVYNLMGQKLVSSQDSKEVSLAQLPAGMYLVQVFNNDMELEKSEKVILNR